MPMQKPMLMQVQKPMQVPMQKPMLMQVQKPMQVQKQLDLNNLQGTVINGYNFISKLGSGAYSNVWLAISPNGVNVAIKVCTGHITTLTRVEVEVFESLQSSSSSAMSQHSNIVNMLETFPHPTDTGLCIVMEYVPYSEIKADSFSKFDEGVDLLSFFTERERPFRSLSKSQQNELVRSITRQIASALLKLNSVGYIHADVKPENILVSLYNFNTNEITVKLCDFGNALSTSNTSYILCQSQYYRAHEVLMHKRNCITPAIDMWSLGCIIWELCMGTPLFNFTQEAKHIVAIEQFIQSDEKVIDDGLLHRLMKNLLMLDPAQRWTATEVLDSLK